MNLYFIFVSKFISAQNILKNLIDERESVIYNLSQYSQKYSLNDFEKGQGVHLIL